MSIHTDIQIRLYDYITGEISPEKRREIDHHLAVCDICLHQCEDLKGFIRSSRTFGKVPSEELPAGYWNDFASEVERRISTQEVERTHIKEKWWAPVFTFIRYRPRIALTFAGTFVILAVAVSLLLPVSADLDFQASDHLADIITNPVNVDERVSQYLKKSKVLLVGLNNMETEEGSAGDLSDEKTASRQLAREAQYLQLQSIDFQAARLIRDLAKVQETFADAESQNEDAALRTIRQSIHNNNLLFKVRMAESVYGDARFVSTVTGSRGGK